MSAFAGRADKHDNHAQGVTACLDAVRKLTSRHVSPRYRLESAPTLSLPRSTRAEASSEGLARRGRADQLVPQGALIIRTLFAIEAKLIAILPKHKKANG